MALQLSGQTERMVDPHREFYGRVIDTMPLLVSGKDEKGNVVDISRIPASFGYVLERRETAPEDVLGEWRNNYIFTGDLVAAGVDGDVIGAWDSPLLRSLTSDSKLNNGALILSPMQWKELKSQKEGVLYLTAREASEGNRKGYIQQGDEWVPANKPVAKVWEHLSRGRALGSYAQIVHKASPSSQGIMNVYFDASERQSPTGRACVAGRVGSNSDANGSGSLDLDYGRLVGVAPEAHVAREKILEARVRMAVDAGQPFRRGDGLLYVPVDLKAAEQLKL